MLRSSIYVSCSSSLVITRVRVHSNIHRGDHNHPCNQLIHVAPSEMILFLEFLCWSETRNASCSAAVALRCLFRFFITVNRTDICFCRGCPGIVF